MSALTAWLLPPVWTQRTASFALDGVLSFVAPVRQGMAEHQACPARITIPVYPRFTMPEQLVWTRIKTGFPIFILLFVGGKETF